MLKHCRISVDGCQLTENFSIDEFCCRRDNGDLVIWLDERFLKFIYCLQEFRTWYGRPININSGFRTYQKNNRVGGSRNSSHLWSLAVDFNLPSEYKRMNTTRKKEFLENVRLKWIRLCRKYGFGAQCNWYDTYLHLGFSLDGKDSILDKRSVKF